MMRRIVYWFSLVLIFTIPWEGAFHLPGFGTSATVMGLVVGASWLVTIFLTGRMRRPVHYLIAVGVFVFWIGLTALWSADPGESMGSVLRWGQNLVFVYILWDLYRTRRAILAGLQAYILGAYLAVIGAILNYFGANAFYENYERYSPGDTNPDGFGLIIALGVPIACYLAGLSDRTRFASLVNYGYVPIAFIGIALSGTRMASIAAAIGLLFGLASLTRLRFFTRVAVVAVLASALFVLLPIVQPLKSFQRLGTTGTEVTEGDLNGRLAQWRQGLIAFREDPLFGVGTNMYRSVNTLDKVAHNSYLSVLVELGLIGFVIFGTILAIVFRHAWMQPTWDRRFWLTVLAVWAIGASTLTWEHRKTTWLFLTFIVAASAIRHERIPVRARGSDDWAEGQPRLAAAREERSYARPLAVGRRR